MDTIDSTAHCDDDETPLSLRADCEHDMPKSDKWSETATMLMLNEFQEKRRLIRLRQIPSLRIMWQMISEILSQEGYNFTSIQVENRWKTLVRSYKKKFKNNRRFSNKGHNRIPFDKEIEEILREQPYLLPSDLRALAAAPPFPELDLPFIASSDVKPISMASEKMTSDPGLSETNSITSPCDWVSPKCETLSPSPSSAVADIPALTSCSESDSAVVFTDGVKGEIDYSLAEQFIEFRNEMEQRHREKEAAIERRHREREVAREKRHAEKIQLLKKIIELLS